MDHKLIYFTVLIIGLSITSCTSPKKLIYFGDVSDKTYYGVDRTDSVLIAPNDILRIQISSSNPEASLLFNQDRNAPSTTATVTGSNIEQGGYLVNSQGFIQLPIIGNVKAAGQTKDQLKQTITSIIVERKLLLSPLVDIRFINYEVTVLGEVGHPTVITVPSEKISVLKAIGLAGDLTIFGNRENILLIRDENGERTTRNINLSSPDFLGSPYYYLKPNDIIYVPPNKARASQSSVWLQLTPILITAMSLGIIIVDRIGR